MIMILQLLGIIKLIFYLRENFRTIGIEIEATNNDEKQIEATNNDEKRYQYSDSRCTLFVYENIPMNFDKNQGSYLECKQDCAYGRPEVFVIFHSSLILSVRACCPKGVFSVPISRGSLDFRALQTCDISFRALIDMMSVSQ